MAFFTLHDHYRSKLQTRTLAPSCSERMQQLDCHQNNGAQFTLVGGKASNFSRKPSYLLERRKSLPVGVLKSRCEDTWKHATKYDSLSGESSQSVGETNGFMEAVVLSWEEDDVEHWLNEADLGDYVVGTFLKLALTYVD